MTRLVEKEKIHRRGHCRGGRDWADALPREVNGFLGQD
jgi:hypothetical protein